MYDCDCVSRQVVYYVWLCHYRWCTMCGCVTTGGALCKVVTVTSDVLCTYVTMSRHVVCYVWL